MVKKLLSALDFPDVDKINTDDENQLRGIVVWLVENKLKNVNSGNLKNVSSPDWPKIFEKLKTAIGCPRFSSRIEEVQWLLGYAIEREYSSKKNAYDMYTVENLKSEKVPNVVAENPLDKLDYRSKEFAEGINTLAKILKITPHPDALVTLKAVRKVITQRLTTQALENPQNYIIQGTPFPFQDLDLGFNLGDPVLTQAAKVLRILYIHNLRDLQTKANELVVAVQNVTANPKTDTKLGKVGR